MTKDHKPFLADDFRRTAMDSYCHKTLKKQLGLPSGELT